MLMPGPQRHDEGVALLPLKRLAVDDRRATAAESVVDAGARVTVRFGFFVASEHLNAARHGRQGRAASGGIDEFQGGAVVGVTGCFRQALQRRVGITPAIVQHGRALRNRTANWTRHAVERRRIDGFVYRQAALFVWIEGYLLQRLNEGHVEAVDPDHVLVALVGVLVPAAVRRENQVAGLHHHLIAIDIGVSAVALQDEAKGRHGVAVAGCDFAGLDQLKR